MVKLVEGDDTQQLRIEVHSVLAYCMNIEECMNVEAEVNGSHGSMILRLITKIVNTDLGP